MAGPKQPGSQVARRFGALAWRVVFAAALTAVVMALALRAHDAAGPDRSGCAAVGSWLDPATGATLPAEQLVASMAQRPVVLLGESHDNAEHHRWQLQMLAALHGRNPNMVLAFESFPRRLQAVLDRWVAGELDAKAFLEAVDWPRVWGYDPALYLPLFHFARQNRVPMIAMNVERDFVSRVRDEGWAAIPTDERASLSDPIPAVAAYRESLAEIYLFEQSHARDDEGDEPPAGDPHAGAPAPEESSEEPAEEPDIEAVLETADFDRFVDAQLTWDRGMAEALAAARQERPGALVVGIVGRGHLEYRHGIPHQLADLGIPDSAVLLPVDRDTACDALPADLADAVFLVEPMGRLVAAGPPKARLGVLISMSEDGVRVANVVEGSVAEATGIAVDDIVVSAAGFAVGTVGELVEIVQRQAPGTWLPLVISRDGAEIELVAKFPQSFEPPE